MSFFAGPYYPAQREKPVALFARREECFLAQTKLRPRASPDAHALASDPATEGLHRGSSQVALAMTSAPDERSEPLTKANARTTKAISAVFAPDTRQWKKDFRDINRTAAGNPNYQQARRAGSAEPKFNMDKKRTDNLQKQQCQCGREVPRPVDLSAIGNPKMLGADEVFKLFDTDNSGLLDRHELIQGLKILGLSVSHKKVDSFIKEYDESGDGLLNLNEFKKCFNMLSQNFGKPRPNEPSAKELFSIHSPSQVPHVSSSSGEGLTLDEEERLRKQLSMQHKIEKPKMKKVSGNQATLLRNQLAQEKMRKIKEKEDKEQELLNRATKARPRSASAVIQRPSTS